MEKRNSLRMKDNVFVFQNELKSFAFRELPIGVI